MKLENKPRKDLRGEIYPICLDLVKKGLEIEAYLLFLSTWNFAAFRYVMTTFDLGEFKKTLKKIEPLHRRLRRMKFKTANFDKHEAEIKTIYSELAAIDGIKMTGAPKLMHLKNPELFVMWDNRIRTYYGFRKGDAKDYINFLKLMQEKFKNQKPRKGETLARTVDVININRITKRRL